MDIDDPEQRIADLERPVTDPSASPPGPLTPDHVRSVVFAKPPFGKRGYNVDDVDAFLDSVEATLHNPSAAVLSAQDARSVAFALPPTGQRGYNEDEVDAFIDAVVAHLDAVEQGRQPPPTHYPRERVPRLKGWFRRLVDKLGGR